MSGSALTIAALSIVHLVAQPQPPVPPVALPSQTLAEHLLRARAESRIIPKLVIVRDEASYLEAISAWTFTTRFPVLLHDGSPEAAEDIARFSRAFEPEAVVEYQAEGDAQWPRDRNGRALRLEQALYAATTDRSDITSMHQWVGFMKDRHALAPGLVVADPDDSLWPAAVALAAGRHQPMIFTRSPGRINAALSLEEAFAVEQHLRDASRQLGLTWESLGDEVDAVTLAVQVPTKVRVRDEPVEFLATTDLLGRTDAPVRARWCYVGQLHGSSARAAYLAMSSLFLSARSAWLFDGYSSERGWHEFDATSAADVLRARGWTITLFDEPRQSLEIWRAAAVRPLSADVVLVNSMGNPDFFRLRPGDAAPGDVPLLDRPVAVHFVHSFSLARPADRDTVGGRWLAHGAYAYFGSVQEPQLAAFVPTPRVAARLAAGLPFAAAVRHDFGEPWKLAVIADPMLTLGAAPARVEAELPLKITSDLSQQAAEAVAQHRFLEAIRLFALLGRDSDASRLALAIQREQPEIFSPEIASAALMSAFRVGRPDDFIVLFRALAPHDREQEIYLDALWHASRLRLYADRSITDLLRQHLRPGQIGADAIELADAIAHQIDRNAAAAFLGSIKPQLKSQREQRQVDRRINELMRGTRP